MGGGNSFGYTRGACNAKLSKLLLKAQGKGRSDVSESISVKKNKNTSSLESHHQLALIKIRDQLPHGRTRFPSDDLRRRRHRFRARHALLASHHERITESTASTSTTRR